MKRLRAFIPNAITISAMCLGLTALRLSYVREDIHLSLLLLVLAAFLDGIDGKIARKLKVESAVGGQLDSLADFLNFCVTPALIVYEWHLKDLYFFGWFATLTFMVGGAYRLARFNVMYAKGAENVSTNYFVGVPSPAGAILAFMPMVVELQGYVPYFPPVAMAFYMVGVAFLMISRLKTPSNRLLNISRKRMPLAAMVGAALIAAIIYHPMDVYLAGAAGYVLITIALFFKNDLYRTTKTR